MKAGIRAWLSLWLSACAFITYLLPNHYPPWMAAHQDWTMALAFFPVILWAVVLPDHKLPLIGLAAFGVAMVPMVQLATGKVAFAGDAWMAAMYLSGFGLTVIAGARFVSAGADPQPDLGRLGALSFAIVLSCLVSTGIALHQWLDLGLSGLFIIDRQPGSRLFANMAQPNQFATLLLLGLAGLMFLFEARRVSAVVALGAAFVLTFALVMTSSRSVLIALCWFWLAHGLLRTRCALRLTPLAAASITIVYFAGVFAWPTLNELLLLPDPAASAASRMGDAGVRTIYWHSMLDAISRAPWAGYGWGQVSHAQQAVALAYPPTHNVFESAHNLALDLVLWMGLPLGLTVLTLLAAWYAGQLFRVRDALSWSLLVGIGFVGSHAMVEYPLYYAYFLLPVGFWIGALSARPATWLGLWNIGPAVNAARIPLAGVALVTLAGFVAISTEYAGLEHDWQQMRYEERGFSNPDKRPPDVLMLTQIGALLRFSRTEARPAMDSSEVEWMRQVSARFGYASVLFKSSLAQALNDDAAGAARTFQLLCSLHEARTCSAGRKEWDLLASTKWPQLHKVRVAIDPPSVDRL